MSDLADQIQKLQDLHASGALTDEEFAHAKAAVLSGNSPSASAAFPALQAHLSQIERQNALAQLDHDWDRRQQQFTVQGRYGRSYIPTQGGSLAGGIVASISSYTKAGQYRQAQDDYQRRRAALLDASPEIRSGNPPAE